VRRREADDHVEQLEQLVGLDADERIVDDQRQRLLLRADPGGAGDAVGEAAAHRARSVGRVASSASRVAPARRRCPGDARRGEVGARVDEIWSAEARRSVHEGRPGRPGRRWGPACGPSSCGGPLDLAQASSSISSRSSRARVSSATATAPSGRRRRRSPARAGRRGRRRRSRARAAGGRGSPGRRSRWRAGAGARSRTAGEAAGGRALLEHGGICSGSRSAAPWAERPKPASESVSSASGGSSSARVAPASSSGSALPGSPGLRGSVAAAWASMASCRSPAASSETPPVSSSQSSGVLARRSRAALEARPRPCGA
jgi:hypothetical protein